jgi:alanine racemase
MMPTRPCWVEISTRTLESNFQFLQTLTSPYAELLAIVKANAYGHSLNICAPAAVRAGAHWLGVTSVEEGVAARALCPKAEILVIGGIFPGQGEAVVRHQLTAVVWEHWQLDELESAARVAGAAAASVPVHLEIDTGMSRQGVSYDELNAGNLASLRVRFGTESPLRLDGVMTHLFAADESDGLVTKEQLVRLDDALAKIAAAGLSGELKPAWLNVGNSAALLSGEAAAIAEIAARHGMKAMLRPGLALYGLAPRFAPDEPVSVADARNSLQPVLSWKTRVVSVRSVEAGAVVGYNGTYVATEPMRLALAAVGYGDGLDRKLGNHFSLLIGGQRAPIVGRISMDQTVLDVTEIPDVVPGDEVVILGEQDGESITVFDHADAAETIPWEVFTRIAARVRRAVV